MKNYATQNDNSALLQRHCSKWIEGKHLPFNKPSCVFIKSGMVLMQSVGFL